jgi:hypothetical protein
MNDPPPELELDQKPPDYVRYERLKTVWIATHPRATAAEYQAAMVRLAKKCGV